MHMVVSEWSAEESGHQEDHSGESKAGKLPVRHDGLDGTEEKLVPSPNKRLVLQHAKSKQTTSKEKQKGRRGLDGTEVARRTRRIHSLEEFRVQRKESMKSATSTEKERERVGTPRAFGEDGGVE